MSTEINKITVATKLPPKSAARLTKLKLIEKDVFKIAAGDIVFSPALITRNEVPIILPGTINLIQGRQGSHKSRLAELICSIMICPEDCSVESSLDFQRVTDKKITVIYVDTERNQKEEFPSAIKSILENAGLSDQSECPNFHCTSIKNVDRKDRLEALKDFISDIRCSSDPLFIILDVASDCIFNINDPVESMKLLDYVGAMCEDLGATFLLVIHENPGSDKARGHVGTEAVNKSATVMHIGFENGANGELSKLIQLKFIKQRHSERLDPIPLVFSQETKSLELADSAFVKSMAEQRRKKVSSQEIVVKLIEYLKPQLDQKELLNALRKDFGCSLNTLKSRLDEIEADAVVMENEHGDSCKLKIVSVSGKPTVYELIQVTQGVLVA